MNRLHLLLTKYKNNECTRAELEELLAYFKLDDNQDLLESEIESILTHQIIDDAPLQSDADEVYLNLKQHILTSKAAPKRFNYSRLMAAACISICFSIGAYLLLPKPGPEKTTSKTKQDLFPGSNKAILTIANGEKIDLTDAKYGKITTQGLTAIDKTKDGQIVYRHADQQTNVTAPIYNTMTTPRGGQYPLTLSDGTKVWLDAASSLTFPVVFIGNERVVSLTGQAYFEVAHNTDKPFKVNTSGQVIEVLGTHFNVNAYSDEPEMKTTLMEGRVKIRKDGLSQELSPGQQAVIKNNRKTIEVKTVDIEEAIAWHKGLFKFKNADIQTVMRQLSRWYNVEVSYEGTITNRRFTGEIYRDVNASKIAEILDYKQIHFRIQGKKIIVLP